MQNTFEDLNLNFMNQIIISNLGAKKRCQVKNIQALITRISNKPT